MAINYIQIPFALETSAPVKEEGGGVIQTVIPVVGASMTVSVRSGGHGSSIVYANRTGTSTVATPETNEKGLVPFWLQEGSYTLSFTGGTPEISPVTVDFDAVYGSGVDYLGEGAVTTPSIGTVVVTGEKIANSTIPLSKLDTSLKNELAALQSKLANTTVQVGDLRFSASETVPSGWMKCEGQSLLRSSYSALFSAIGIKFGSLDGTHFSLPDYRERVPMGAGLGTGGSGGSGPLVGTSGGEWKHILSSSEMPSHNHTQNAHGHAQTAHAHASIEGGFLVHQNNPGLPYGLAVTGADPYKAGGDGIGGLYSNIGNATLGANANIFNETATNNPAGGGTAHNNIQPYTCCVTLIRVEPI